MGVNSVARLYATMLTTRTMYPTNLAKHLKRCQANKPQELPPFIVPGINAGESKEVVDAPVLSSLPEEEVLKLLKKVEEAYDKYSSKYPVPDKILCHNSASQFYPRSYTK